jgi:hypothetical protein
VAACMRVSASDSSLALPHLVLAQNI